MSLSPRTLALLSLTLLGPGSAAANDLSRGPLPPQQYQSDQNWIKQGLKRKIYQLPPTRRLELARPLHTHPRLPRRPPQRRRQPPLPTADRRRPLGRAPHRQTAMDRRLRSPTFIKLYSQNNPVVIGQRNLHPERLRNLEASHAFNDSRTHLRATVFHIRLDQLIGIDNSTTRVLLGVILITAIIVGGIAYYWSTTALPQLRLSEQSNLTPHAHMLEEALDTDDGNHIEGIIDGLPILQAPNTQRPVVVRVEPQTGDNPPPQGRPPMPPHPHRGPLSPRHVRQLRTGAGRRLRRLRRQAGGLPATTGKDPRPNRAGRGRLSPRLRPAPVPPACRGR